MVIIPKQYKYDEDEVKQILELVKTLNIGNCREAESRVAIAVRQYEQFKKQVMLAEIEEKPKEELTKAHKCSTAWV